MVSTAQLWLPILVAAIGVFVASTLIHTVFKWHNADYLKLGNEDEVRAALGRTAPPPGMYQVPHCLEGQQMRQPETQKKFIEGPVAMLFVRGNGLPNLPAHLGKWFALNLVVALIVGHVAGYSVATTATGLRIFYIAALVTFLAYSAGSVTNGIWFGQPWRAVGKDLLDALIYGVVSGCAFAWLWPSATT